MLKAPSSVQAPARTAMLAVAKRSPVLLVLMAFVNTDIAAQGMAPSWVWPTHPTSEPIEKTFTVVDIYRYTEREFTPAFTVKAVTKKDRSSETPEKAAISRFSSMIKLDYDWWMSTWLADDRPIVQERGLAEGRDPEFWVQWWRDSFRFSRVRLTRRIDSGDFVILTYHLVLEDGTDAANNIEWASQTCHCLKCYEIHGVLSRAPGCENNTANGQLYSAVTTYGPYILMYTDGIEIRRTTVNVRAGRA